jgi:hypothetical protein
MMEKELMKELYDTGLVKMMKMNIKKLTVEM